MSSLHLQIHDGTNSNVGALWQFVHRGNVRTWVTFTSLSFFAQVLVNIKVITYSPLQATTNKLYPLNYYKHREK
jgi:hypothetical protein